MSRLKFINFTKMEDNSKAIAVWNKVLGAAMSLPGVKVNRKEFLSGKLLPYCTHENALKAINGNPTKVIDIAILNKIADSVISSHTTKVTAISAVAGLPGGIAMAATIPADIAQYYWHTLVVSQKLAYIYGWPDLLDKDGNLSDDAVNLLTVFLGVMSGVAVANEGINAAARALSVQVVKRLPKMALTKTVIYPIAKQVAKWLGIQLTKENFAKAIGKAIPVLGGIISGGITLSTFLPQARRLKRKLQKQADLFKNAKETIDTKNVEDVEYEDVSSDTD